MFHATNVQSAPLHVANVAHCFHQAQMSLVHQNLFSLSSSSSSSSFSALSLQPVSNSAYNNHQPTCEPYTAQCTSKRVHTYPAVS